jgi:uncharacterized protein (DUF433 family)
MESRKSQRYDSGAFMEAAETNFYGVGIYSVAEASRLTGVSGSRIRRTVRGYAFKSAGRVLKSPPVFSSQLPVIDGEIAVGFLDLIEVRFVDAFLRRGVSWSTVRKAEAKGRALFDTTHPFATKHFRTDGRGIFADIGGRADKAVIELASSQLAFSQVVSPFLAGIDFDGDAASRWWPLGASKRVVIDPARSFGQPIVAREGVPTAVLAAAVRAEGAEDVVARTYEVSLASVRHAVEFEKKLAA